MILIDAIEENSRIAIELFANFQDDTLTYDEESVAKLDYFIEQKREVFNRDTIDRMVQVFGSFLGQCIRRNYGGEWDEIGEGIGVRFDEKNGVFPFGKVRKQFENGPEDSILSLYQMIPMVFKNLK